MNEKLKFSWFNILTLVAMIAIGYTSFVGLTYMTDGNFTIGGIGTAIILVVLFVYFVVMQNLKSTTVYLRRKLKWEAVMLILSPLVFAVSIIPATHFFTVTARNESIVNNFTTSISGSRQLFDDYKTYADNRLKNIAASLNLLTANGLTDENRQAYSIIGLTPGKETMQIENIVEATRLQLLSDNFTRFVKEANKWIDEANQGASTYNVFLLGNTRQIKETINQWEKDLNDMATHRMTAENALNLDTSFSSRGASDAVKGIESLTGDFTTRKFPNFWAILFAFGAYLFLLLPYIFQSRNARNPYRLTDLFSSYDDKRPDFIPSTGPADKNSAPVKSKKATRQAPLSGFDENGGFTLD